MQAYFLRPFSIALLTFCAAITQADAQESSVPKYKFNLPPSAELQYAVKAKQSGLSIEGETLTKWKAADGKFSLSNEVRAMLVGKILETTSEGGVDDYGLAPTSYTEKRFHKAATTASFNRETKAISFSASDLTYPIKGGEQDRNTAIWQLLSVARAAPAKFKPGAEWPFFVVGQHDADPWTFKTLRMEKIKTPLGDLSALHLSRSPQPDKKGQQVDIWIAPTLDWYPVRIRYTDPDGEFIEQTLSSVKKL